MCIYLKGAPETVIARCTTMLDSNEKPTDLDTCLRAKIYEANERFASKGERVVAFARLELDESKLQDYAPFDLKKW
jgi:magnesium-transporting ATPase (P-type)